MEDTVGQSVVSTVALIAAPDMVAQDFLAALLLSVYPDVEIVTSASEESALDALTDHSFDIVLVTRSLAPDAGVRLVRVGASLAPGALFVSVGDECEGVNFADPVQDGALIDAGVSDFMPMGDASPSQLARSLRFAARRRAFEDLARAEGDRLLGDLGAARGAAMEMAEAKARLEGALALAEEAGRRYRMLTENSPVGIWHMTDDGETAFMNDALRAMLELEPDAPPVGLASAVVEDNREEAMRSLEKWVDGTRHDVELHFAGRRGGRRCAVLSGTRTPEGVLVTALEITERKEVETAIQHLAHHDVLTGLPNRALFWERLRHAIATSARQGKEMAVLFLDLDHFKDVNDTLGHPIGDKLLKEVSSRLLSCIRDTDTVARLGGDEFAVLSTNLDHGDQVRYLAQRIVESIARPVNIENHEIHTATSIGIAIYPTDCTDPDGLVRFADMALYNAKEGGRSAYHFFDRQMDDAVQRRKALESELREALERGEFELYYQPQMALETRQVTGAEALIRWRHPTRGLVSPVEFVPIAEQCGLIGPIGEWVMQAAFAQAKAWKEELVHPVRIAINLSAVQFRQKFLFHRIKELLSESGIDPDLIEFEITESMVMEDTALAIAIMRGLRSLGIRLSIDDFGTGFSSLAYLKKFPVNYLKVDRSFVSNIPHDQDDAVISASIIRLAHSLGLKVVAEGVETEAQVDFLAAERCDYVQGYFFGKPMAASEMVEKMGLVRSD